MLDSQWSVYKNIPYLPLSLITITVFSLMVYWQYAGLTVVCIQKHSYNYLLLYTWETTHC